MSRVYSQTEQGTNSHLGTWGNHWRIAVRRALPAVLRVAQPVPGTEPGWEARKESASAPVLSLQPPTEAEAAPRLEKVPLTTVQKGLAKG